MDSEIIINDIRSKETSKVLNIQEALNFYNFFVISLNTAPHCTIHWLYCAIHYYSSRKKKSLTAGVPFFNYYLIVVLKNLNAILFLNKTFHYIECEKIGSQSEGQNSNDKCVTNHS